ncbi:MAG: GGDEF domain-containing protein [Sulfurimonadaceae bacterium]|nr:GGDEF domain-containing protein [Sulfurimonadaceae bacterium]
MHDAFSTLKTSLAFYFLALLFPISIYYTDSIVSQIDSDRAVVAEFKTVQDFLHMLTHEQPESLKATMINQTDSALERIHAAEANTLFEYEPNLQIHFESFNACWKLYKQQDDTPHTCWQHAKKSHAMADRAVTEKHKRQLDALFLLLLASMIITVAVIYIIRNQMKLQMDRYSMYDPATGMYNRNYFQSQARKVISLSNRHGHSVSLLYISLEHYDEISKGQVSDRLSNVLHTFGKLVMGLIRESDIACRYDDNVFLIITPQTNTTQVAVLAERLFSKTEIIENHSVKIGAAQYEDGEDIEKFIERAKASMERTSD